MKWEKNLDEALKKGAGRASPSSWTLGGVVRLVPPARAHDLRRPRRRPQRPGLRRRPGGHRGLEQGAKVARAYQVTTLPTILFLSPRAASSAASTASRGPGSSRARSSSCSAWPPGDVLGRDAHARADDPGALLALGTHLYEQEYPRPGPRDAPPGGGERRSSWASRRGAGPSCCFAIIETRGAQLRRGREAPEGGPSPPASPRTSPSCSSSWAARRCPPPSGRGMATFEVIIGSFRRARSRPVPARRSPAVPQSAEKGRGTLLRSLPLGSVSSAQPDAPRHRRGFRRARAIRGSVAHSGGPAPRPSRSSVAHSGGPRRPGFPPGTGSRRRATSAASPPAGRGRRRDHRPARAGMAATKRSAWASGIQRSSSPHRT